MCEPRRRHVSWVFVFFVFLKKKKVAEEQQPSWSCFVRLLRFFVSDGRFSIVPEALIHFSFNF